MLHIDYFSDLLCVWAYGTQRHLTRLQNELGSRVLVRQRFVPLFADTSTRIGRDWEGGFAGFSGHTRELCSAWPHTRLHADVWALCRPASCIGTHAFLQAAALCLGLDEARSGGDHAVTRRFDALVDTVRNAFFEQALDISRLDVLMELLHAAQLSAEAVRERLENGEAYAAAHRDAELAKRFGVVGSPTYVMDGGRQLLYGNLSYAVILANATALLAVSEQSVRH